MTVTLSDATDANDVPGRGLPPENVEALRAYLALKREAGSGQNGGPRRSRLPGEEERRLYDRVKEIIIERFGRGKNIPESCGYAMGSVGDELKQLGYEVFNKIMLELTRDPEVNSLRDKDGYSIAHSAVCSSTAEELIRDPKRASLADNHGLTVAHEAVRVSKPAARYAIAHKEVALLADRYGRTVEQTARETWYLSGDEPLDVEKLIRALDRQDLEAVEGLLKSGELNSSNINMKIPRAEGTLLNRAGMWRNHTNGQEIVDLLVAAGAR